MAVSQEDIVARIQQIQQAGGGDTAATRAQIAKEAQQFNVSPEQLAQATGLSAGTVRDYAREAGQSFAPSGLLQTAEDLKSGRITREQAQDVVNKSVGLPASTSTTGMLNTTPTFDVYQPTITSGLFDDIAEGDSSALSDLLYSIGTSGEDTGQYRGLIEQLATSATGDKGTDPAYNTLVGASAQAKLRGEYNDAVARGDFARAEEIDNVVKQGTDAAFRFYEDQYGEGSAHKLVQQTFNDPFGIGEPGKYQTSFFENIGDAVSDVVQNPYVQAATAFIPGVGPAVSSVLQAWGTLDSGEELSPAQIVAAVTGVSELSGLEGGNLIAKLPPQIRETATAIQKGLEGGWDEAYAALKDAGLEGTSEQFAAFEDAIRTVVGDDNIETISGGLAGFEDFARGLFEGDLAGLGGRLSGLEELLAGLETEGSVGTGFAPQRGYQPGLAVDLDFDLAERSAVLDILNQPSSVRRA
jgi:hypothetical protein